MCVCGSRHTTACSFSLILVSSSLDVLLSTFFIIIIGNAYHSRGKEIIRLMRARAGGCQRSLAMEVMDQSGQSEGGGGTHDLKLGTRRVQYGAAQPQAVLTFCAVVSERVLLSDPPARGGTLRRCSVP